MNTSVAAFEEAFRVLGYERCPDGAPEEGFEKIAIYELNSEVTHIARQLTTGQWTSKIGYLEDIEHASPAELEESDYGKVVEYMRRPRPLGSGTV